MTHTRASCWRTEHRFERAMDHGEPAEGNDD
jgi:hypothetical protein